MIAAAATMKFVEAAMDPVKCGKIVQDPAYAAFKRDLETPSEAAS